MYNNPFTKLVWYDSWEAFEKRCLIGLQVYPFNPRTKTSPWDWQNGPWDWYLAFWSNPIQLSMMVSQYLMESPGYLINVAESIYYQLFNLLVWQSLQLNHRSFFFLGTGLEEVLIDISRAYGSEFFLSPEVHLSHTMNGPGNEQGTPAPRDLEDCFRACIRERDQGAGRGVDLGIMFPAK